MGKCISVSLAQLWETGYPVVNRQLQVQLNSDKIAL